jgi:RND family efflux transporter MFP subunit
VTGTSRQRSNPTRNDTDAPVVRRADGSVLERSMKAPDSRLRVGRRSCGRLAVFLTLLALVGGVLSGCRTATSDANPASADAALTITSTPVVQRQVTRTLRVTGSLTAEEQADVAAETGGRVVATPVERGSSVNEGDALIRLAPLEADASAREAEANVAQLEARLSLKGGEPFDVERVPEVAAAKATSELAQADFARIRTLLDQRVVSQAEFDQRRAQVEATRNQYEAARNGARQMYRQYEAASARLSLARKSLADTTVRAPFSGLVAERKVSVGDFVTRGTKVVTVVKMNPLRVELTVPEQMLSAIKAGQALTLQVDAYPGRKFDGRVRFISPAVRADQRSLMVEAVVPNPEGLLRPGLFASALVDSAVQEPARLVPATALRTDGSVSRLFVVRGDHVEERVVKVGQASGDLVEIAAGVADGDQVAVSGVSQLSDGVKVRITGASGATAR